MIPAAVCLLMGYLLGTSNMSHYIASFKKVDMRSGGSRNLGASNALLMLGFFLLLPVFLEYFATGLVPRFPTLFFGCFLMLFAFCSLICGLILDTQAQHHKQDAEIRRNMIAMMLRKEK